MARQHTIHWNKVRAVPTILHRVGVNWNSRSEIDTAYTGKCDVELNNKQVPVNYFIVLLPTKYLFIVMQISEYDITNEIGEHSYI
jgi:hypothetical protein